MTTKHVTNFKSAYQKLKSKHDWKFSIELYHHDFNSEPFLHTESYIEKVILDYVDEHGLIITVMTPDATYSFSENNWLVHVDDDYVSFGSKNDNDTHCIIEFC